MRDGAMMSALNSKTILKTTIDLTAGWLLLMPHSSSEQPSSEEPFLVQQYIPKL